MQLNLILLFNKLKGRAISAKMLNFVFNKTEFEESHQSDYMGYREEAIECVKDIVLPIHKQIYAEFDGNFDKIYSEGYNSKSYQGRVIEPGKVYELSYLDCSCPKVKCGLRSNPQAKNNLESI